MDNTYSDESKLTITNILYDAAGLYKKNFKGFIILRIFAFLIVIPDSVLLFLSRIIDDRSFSIMNSAFRQLFMIAMIVIIPVFSIATYIYISGKFMDRGINIKQALTEVRGKYWRFIGIDILRILIVMAPFVAGGIISIPPLISLDRAGNNAYHLFSLIILILIISLSILTAIYLYTIFNFSALNVVIGKERRPSLSMSYNLVKGDFWRTIFLTAFFLFITTAPFLFFLYINIKILPPDAYLAATLIYQILNVFITPYRDSVWIILYHRLSEKKIGL